jgi:acetyltransferase-like isoleucine patch superfamily enzyme
VKIVRIIYIAYLRWRLKHDLNVKLKSSVRFTRHSQFGGFNVIGDFSDVSNSQIGLGSYLGVNCRLPKSLIGKFCSIAHNVEVLPFTHPSRDFVSTHPSFFSIVKQAGFTFVENQLFEETIYADDRKRYHLVIGNDVWIGANVTFIGGVKIGDGAIVAAGSVVTRNVEPFSIVGGVPSKHIRFRFEKNFIEFLIHDKWWERDFDWIKENAQDFTDIKKYEKKFRIE